MDKAEILNKHFASHDDNSPAPDLGSSPFSHLNICWGGMQLIDTGWSFLFKTIGPDGIPPKLYYIKWDGNWAIS